MASDQSLGTDCSSHTVCTRSSKIVYNVNSALQPPTFTISGSMHELSPALPLFLRLHSTLSWCVSLLALVGVGAVLSSLALPHPTPTIHTSIYYNCGLKLCPHLLRYIPKVVGLSVRTQICIYVIIERNGNYYTYEY